MATTMLITNFKPKVVLNLGSCGALEKDLNVFDVALIDKVQYLDVDLTTFGYQKNQIPRQPSIFVLETFFNDSLKNYLIDQKIKYKNAHIGSCDYFVNQANYDSKNFLNIDLVDMELAAIAQVCYVTKTNLVALKIVSDKINEPVNNDQQFNNNLQKIDVWFNQHLIGIIKALINKNQEV